MICTTRAKGVFLPFPSPASHLSSGALAFPVLPGSPVNLRLSACSSPQSHQSPSVPSLRCRRSTSSPCPSSTSSSSGFSSLFSLSRAHTHTHTLSLWHPFLLGLLICSSSVTIRSIPIRFLSAILRGPDDSTTSIVPPSRSLESFQWVALGICAARFLSCSNHMYVTSSVPIYRVSPHPPLLSPQTSLSSSITRNH